MYNVIVIYICLLELNLQTHLRSIYYFCIISNVYKQGENFFFYLRLRYSCRNFALLISVPAVGLIFLNVSPN